MSYDAVEIGVPQQHGAVIARWRVQVKNQSVGAVLLPADVRHVVANHYFLRGRVHPLYVLCGKENVGVLANVRVFSVFRWKTAVI